jgi:hypothetical protein
VDISVPSDPFIARQIEAVCDALPTARDEPPGSRAARQEDARTLFASLNPRDAVEAALAAQAVLAHFTALAMYKRAADASLAPPDALRLSSAARAEARAFKTTAKDLEKRHTQAAKETAADEPPQEIEQVPPIEVFQPRDRYGNPIPMWRNDLMTRKQKRAAYNFQDKAAWEEARLEEEATIAEQRALDAVVAAQAGGEPTSERYSQATVAPASAVISETS